MAEAGDLCIKCEVGQLVPNPLIQQLLGEDSQQCGNCGYMPDLHDDIEELKQSDIPQIRKMGEMIEAFAKDLRVV